jgi:hypothetical protein
MNACSIKNCAIIFLLTIYLAGCQSLHTREVRIPAENEWRDHGIVLAKGARGEWDARLTGMINPCTVVKKNGTYFLYYLGACGDRTTDGGPAFRALGLATSTNGIDFVKYSGNPILEHIPHHNQEEGIFSAGSSLDENDNIALHYGAIWASDSTTESVRSQIALATSKDGFNFTDRGYTVRWDDPDVWGYGDEISPIGSMRTDGQWHVYYIAKGIYTPKWSLGLASGPTADSLPDTQAAVSEPDFVDGGGDPVLIGRDKAAVIIKTRKRRLGIEIRTASLSNPARISAPVERYDFGMPLYGLTVFLDADLGKWFMYYLSGTGDAIRVKTAPASAIIIGSSGHRIRSRS